MPGVDRSLGLSRHERDKHLYIWAGPPETVLAKKLPKLSIIRIPKILTISYTVIYVTKEPALPGPRHA